MIINLKNKNIYSFFHPGYLPNNKYWANNQNSTSTSNSSVTVTSSEFSFFPISIYADINIVNIIIEITTGQSNSGIRMGFYTARNGVPKTLIHDCGEILTNTTGEKTASVNKKFLAGAYFVGLRCSSSGLVPSIRTVQNSHMHSIVGASSFTANSLYSGIRNATIPYGDLPSLLNLLPADYSFNTSVHTPLIVFQT